MSAFLLAGVMSLSVFLAPTGARAEELRTVLQDMIVNHDRVQSARAQVDAASNRAREALGAWFPTLSGTGNIAYERQEKPEQLNTNFTNWEWEFTLTQLLWDFGATNGQVEAARLIMGQSKASLDAARQALLLEGLTAFINLQRSASIVDYARQSEDNIRRQTGLEETRVERGSGLTTDVLQSKTQLAGAEARRVQGEGALQLAMNRYKAVFDTLPGDLDGLSIVREPEFAVMPESLDEALSIAFEVNPSLRAAQFAAAASHQTVRSTRGDSFFPRIEFEGSRSEQFNVGGTEGYKTEGLVKLQATWSFNLGGTAFNTLRASQADAVVADRTFADARRQVEERVRNAWHNLETFRSNASILRNQANIAGEFLELARRERQLGQRSLIDLLAGETALFNAQSDAESAEADVKLAAYSLLAAMGVLEVEVIR
ncbi:MAG: TolC family protein [Rhodospirillaceae bacterium]